jgi:hypothetical protein
MIPRVIHYCWFGNTPLPASAERCLASWRQTCPDYDIRRWDERSFDVARCTFCREAHAAGKWAFVSDYARLRIIFEHGGIYLDTDVELLESPNPLLAHAAFFGFQQDGTIATGLGFGAIPAHPLVGALMKHYETTSFLGPSGLPDATPCPARDAAVFRQFGFRLDGSPQDRDGVVVLPADVMCPKSYDTGRVRITPRTLSIHHFDASWHNAVEAADLAKRRRYSARFGDWLGPRLYRASHTAGRVLAPIRRALRSRP